MSTKKLSNEEVNLLAKGLKFVPTPITNQNKLRHELMQDFKRFARTMRLQYLYANSKEKPHPYHVKSKWQPPVTQSVALESFLDETKLQISKAAISKPKDNLTKGERKALKTLNSNKDIIIKKADKGTTTVIMDKIDKIKEAEIQLHDTNYYQPLKQPMVLETADKVNDLIRELFQKQFIDKKNQKNGFNKHQTRREYQSFTL